MDDREYSELLRKTMSALTEKAAGPTKIDAILRNVKRGVELIAA